MRAFIKRTIDVIVSFIAVFGTLPITISAVFLVWLYDRKNPIYFAPRVGKNGKIFKMVKIRSMIVNAEKTGVDSTSSDDKRITPIGKIVRKFKLDELTQFWNVLIGQMSVVGPRPNVKRETDCYTTEESKLLSVKPGITDFASIVFSDEGRILEGMRDPDLAYNQLIRPTKSRLGLFYIENQSLFVDLSIIVTTAISIFSRNLSLTINHKILKALNAAESLILISLRNSQLVPAPPPGATKIVTVRDEKFF
jgi:lipopolysaccharide/colanic/teichoic acid biosynthesis glycosyltransferase